MGERGPNGGEGRIPIFERLRNFYDSLYATPREETKELPTAPIQGQFDLSTKAIATPDTIGEEISGYTVETNEFRERLESRLETIVQDRREQERKEREQREAEDTERIKQQEINNRETHAKIVRLRQERIDVALAERQQREIRESGNSQITELAHQAAIFMLNNGGKPHYIRPSAKFPRGCQIDHISTLERKTYEKLGIWIISFKEEKKRILIEYGNTSSSAYSEPVHDNRHDNGWGHSAGPTYTYGGESGYRTVIKSHTVGTAFDYSGRLWDFTSDPHITFSPKSYLGDDTYTAASVESKIKEWSNRLEELAAAHLTRPKTYTLSSSLKDE